MPYERWIDFLALDKHLEEQPKIGSTDTYHQLWISGIQQSALTRRPCTSSLRVWVCARWGSGKTAWIWLLENHLLSRKNQSSSVLLAENNAPGPDSTGSAILVVGVVGGWISCVRTGDARRHVSVWNVYTFPEIFEIFQDPLFQKFQETFSFHY